MPERHQRKPAVQAAAVMLRTPPINGQSPASQPCPLPIYGTQFWEPPRHSPVSDQKRTQTPPSRPFALCRHITGWMKVCNYGSHYVAIATQPVPRLQIRPILHNSGAASTMPPSYIWVRAVVWAYGRGQTDRQTDRQTDTEARDHTTFCVVYDSCKM